MRRRRRVKTPYVVSSTMFQRLHLDIQMGDHPVDHKPDHTRGSMENLESSLTHLRDQMINIIRQQDYQRVDAHSP